MQCGRIRDGVAKQLASCVVCRCGRVALTFTNEQLVIIEEAHGTLAPEAANHVDAHAVFTDPRDLPALINI